MRKIVQKVVCMQEHRVAVLVYAMAEGSEVQYLTVLPKEGRRILKEFKETGKIRLNEDFRRRVVVLEPMRMSMAYTGGWYIKVPRVVEFEES